MKTRHILIADDEKHTRITLSLIFKKVGYKVTIAENGLEALNKTIELKKSDCPVDLLVIDIQMPGLTGLEVIEELKKQKLFLPILMISGYTEKEMLTEIIQKNFVEYMGKPFEPEEIIDHVSSLISRHALNQNMNIEKALQKF